MSKEKINYLSELGCFRPTIRGDELKGYIDGDGFYLSAADCLEVARQFTEAAAQLKKQAS